MVYDSETYQILHELTDEGKKNYNNMLEEKADEILFKNEHPFRYYKDKLFSWIWNKFIYNDNDNF